jgi:hypothetical protein
MDDDDDRLGRFRLPESFAESGDPVEANPFPPEHPAHQVWMDATRKAEMELSCINTDAPALLTPATAHEWMLMLVVAKFDVWARRGVQVAWTDDAVRSYGRWLVDYANAWIESLFTRVTHLPRLPREMFLDDLRRRLAARVQHWKAEAGRHRVQHEALAAAAAPETLRPPSRELVERRRRAVRKYCKDHDLDAVGFARAVGVSDSVIRGIIREDRGRFDRGVQEKLLSLIAMAREQWYRE